MLGYLFPAVSVWFWAIYATDWLRLLSNTALDSTSAAEEDSAKNENQCFFF